MRDAMAGVTLAPTKTAAEKVAAIRTMTLVCIFEFSIFLFLLLRPGGLRSHNMY